jgi:cbb3-type cytochrome c oxidase subunit III
MYGAISSSNRSPRNIHVNRLVRACWWGAMKEHLKITNAQTQIDEDHSLWRIRRFVRGLNRAATLAVPVLLVTVTGIWGTAWRNTDHSVVHAAGPDGHAIFTDHCATCHGADGKGISPVGTPDFTDLKIQASLTDEAIIDTITNGRKGTIMPAWKGQLSPQEISAVAEFVRSLGH